MNDKLMKLTVRIFENMDLSPILSEVFGRIIIGTGVALLAFLLWIISIKIVLRFVEIIVKRTKVTWDDDLVEQGVFNRLARTIPAFTLWFMAPAFLTGLPQLLHIVRILAVLGIIKAVTLTAFSFLNFINAVYDRRADAGRRPIKGLIQAFQVILIATALMLSFSVITDQPVSGLLAGLGAVSAVIMLIFKDPLMGLVSGFQISSNDLVRIGDWIEVPSQGADGDVVDISLLNVTVQNWDRTWVTFPIQSLTNTGFKNWRGMSESGGRRIKRSLSIDLSSIRFLKEEEIENLKSVKLLKEYLENRSREIEEHNKTLNADRTASPLNGRALTNVGVFRTSHYEDIQSDIFDHLFAALPEFSLRAFQNPSGFDIEDISNALKPAEEG